MMDGLESIAMAVAHLERVQQDGTVNIDREPHIAAKHDWNLDGVGNGSQPRPRAPLQAATTSSRELPATKTEEIRPPATPTSACRRVSTESTSTRTSLAPPMRFVDGPRFVSGEDYTYRLMPMARESSSKKEALEYQQQHGFYQNHPPIAVRASSRPPLYPPPSTPVPCPMVSTTDLTAGTTTPASATTISPVSISTSTSRQKHTPTVMASHNNSNSVDESAPRRMSKSTTLKPFSSPVAASLEASGPEASEEVAALELSTSNGCMTTGTAAGNYVPLAQSFEAILKTDLEDSKKCGGGPPVPGPHEAITIVKENDVLCGRGGETNHHIGNKRYRELVKMCQPAYLVAKRREKPRIAKWIVLAVRKAGGRFLKKDLSPAGTSTNVWRDVGNVRAREKTSQALREGAPEMRNTMVATSPGDEKAVDDAEQPEGTESLREEYPHEYDHHHMPSSQPHHYHNETDAPVNFATSYHEGAKRPHSATYAHDAGVDGDHQHQIGSMHHLRGAFSVSPSNDGGMMMHDHAMVAAQRHESNKRRRVSPSIAAQQQHQYLQRLQNAPTQQYYYHPHAYHHHQQHEPHDPRHYSASPYQHQQAHYHSTEHYHDQHPSHRPAPAPMMRMPPQPPMSSFVPSRPTIGSHASPPLLPAQVVVTQATAKSGKAAALSGTVASAALKGPQGVPAAMPPALAVAATISGDDEDYDSSSHGSGGGLVTPQSAATTKPSSPSSCDGTIIADSANTMQPAAVPSTRSPGRGPRIKLLKKRLEQSECM